MGTRRAVIASTLVLAAFASSARAQPYFPPRHAWETRTPAEAGMNEARLRAAIAFAQDHESTVPRDLALAHELGLLVGPEPYGERVGPSTVRAPLNGLVVRGGRIVAEWGETSKVDMTFSVSKTFLSTVVGVAWDRGLIASLDDRAADCMPTDELFQGEQNARITWDHLLRQTSDWEGTLFGKPDWADRPEGEDPSEYPDRVKHEPGTHYKYNDVRVNLLALVALNVWRRPLPQVLREAVMDPIGASSTWRWYGYDNSWVLIDGVQVQSVSGGGHWGGGMHISARDMARFGYLFLRDGVWDGKRLVSEEWIRRARTPGVNPAYGFMNWFLNLPYTSDDGARVKSIPAAPDSAVTFRGAGANIIYIDRENDLVVVVRWIGSGFNEFIEKVLGSIERPAATESGAPPRQAWRR